MRSVAEFRKRQLEMLEMAFVRPIMFGNENGKMAENFFSTVIRDLCWFEEREKEHSILECDLLHGSQGVYGQFYYQHLKIPGDYLPEVTSTYAQAAFRLGYFNPPRLLSEVEFKKMQENLNNQFFSKDHLMPELTERFGEPTIDVFSSATTVHCYGCENRNLDWIYLDYSRCYLPEDGRDYKYFDDEILRDVRQKKNIFKLLPFASWCKKE